MKVEPARIKEYGGDDGRFCPACVYWSDNLVDAGLLPAAGAQACSLGCILDDPVCREMRTSNCSIKKRPF